MTFFIFLYVMMLIGLKLKPEATPEEFGVFIIHSSIIFIGFILNAIWSNLRGIKGKKEETNKLLKQIIKRMDTK